MLLNKYAGLAIAALAYLATGPVPADAAPKKDSVITLVSPPLPTGFMTCGFTNVSGGTLTDVEIATFFSDGFASASQVFASTADETASVLDGEFIGGFVFCKITYEGRVGDILTTFCSSAVGCVRFD